MGIRITKEPWWIRHRTIGFAAGLVLFVFAFFTFGILHYFEVAWMNVQGFSWDSVRGGYTHRKTGERR